jgi:hypothetical protein
MKLLAIGDSFTYGEELTDRSAAWPNILGKNLGYEVTNLGKPAAGNTYMVRSVLEHADNYDLIIIAWSHFARIEVADEHGIYDVWPGCNLHQFQNEIEYRSKLAEYFSRHYNDQYLYNQYLLNNVVVQSYLKLKGKRYILLNAFGEPPKLTYHTANQEYINQAIISQIDKKYFLGGPYDTMMQWTYGCPQGTRGHFLEQGHQRVADKINEHIRHLGWVS